jgi:glutathione S-transferase
MVRLLHFPLDPFSRRIRMTLSEMGIDTELLEERPWEARADFIELNPAATLPVMIDEDGTVCAGVEAAGAHLDETRAGEAASLWGTSAEQRAEVRRLVAWFDGKFHHEVTSPLLMEKIVKRFVPAAQGGGSPNMNRVRAATAALKVHLGIHRQPDRRAQPAGRQQPDGGRPCCGLPLVSGRLYRRHRVGRRA